MALFLAFAIPLVITVVVNLFFPDEQGDRKTLLPALYGFLFALPAIIFHMVTKKPLPGSFLFSDLVVHSFIFGELQIYLLVLLFFHLTFLFNYAKKEDRLSGSPELQGFLFFGAFFAAFSITEAVLYAGSYTNADLFYIPIVRIAFLFITVPLLALIEEETGIKRVLFFLALIVFPAIAALGYPLFFLKQYGASVTIMAFLLGGSFTFFFFWIRSQYEGAGGAAVPVNSAGRKDSTVSS